MDGSVSTSVTENSHIWQCGASPALDTGTLASANFDFTENAIYPYSVVTNDDFGLGVRDVLSNDNIQAQLVTPNLGAIPTRPTYCGFLFGMVLRIDAIPASGLAAIATHYDAPAQRGWFAYFDCAGADARKIRFSLYRNTTLTPAISPVAFDLGVPFAVFFNLDCSGGYTQIITSFEGGTVQSALVDPGGEFGPGDDTPIILGRSGIAVGWEGIIAQAFDVDYIAAKNAGVTQANMTNFLKHADGYLTV